MQKIRYFSIVLSFHLALAVHHQGNGRQQPILNDTNGKDGATIPIRFDDTSDSHWASDFELIDIPSSRDGSVQKAYFYKAKSTDLRPLVVSLHTWSGTYEQKDDLALLCQQKNVNYIHPDFRGANRSIDACCSELAMNDIDDAIRYAMENAPVDTSQLFVIGVSGGGYATLSTFMKSTHPIKKFSAWASISDLAAWHHESQIRKNRYANDILACTGSDTTLDTLSARDRSPLFWNTPIEKLDNTELHIYAGIYDGIQGSVPFTHSINFYNKLLSDQGITDAGSYVSDAEKLMLLERRQPLGDFGSIDRRRICLVKESGNLRITVFEGNHEMLTEFALEELLGK
ncbi:MAG: prolyl oligopeptidase family serine peptidase [Lunatimonas sp.]|uniref:alpha/beta hydrolase family protein n=1 Tax=Lunatimonas sp. TaxID=2060141 RepID=UPI00263B12C8|nr:prolyl oligopeptidase family serine peptidase [Lunatimonas sp.]MCC5939505.1 prolyl oligopeptidase family serine peptidase [Lunatimonas sp.]